MSLSSLNITQQAQALNALFESTASSVAPLLLFESFMIGVLCACVPIGSYMLWAQPLPFPRTPPILMLWLFLTGMIAHWAFSLRQLHSTLSGRSLGVSVTLDALNTALDMIEHSGPDNSWVLQNDLIEIVDNYDTYGRVWQVLLPLVAETVLFGFASFLFSMAAYTSFDIFRFRGRSCFSLVIPVMASVMYTLSLAHWAVSVHYFAVSAKITYIGNPNGTFATQKSFTALVSMNAVMSDSIVLWRMYVVWNRARPILAYGIAAFFTILGLNIANIVGLAYTRASRGVVNLKDPEFFVIYGITSIGLAAAFVSLASNLCATALVGLKIWLHRRQLTTHVRTGNRRTMVERVMELLVDSGVVYTAIWLLYCTSFFRPITDQVVLGPASKGFTIDITAASYLDAAMAQITSIYPLIVFILVALDKIHHSRGPQILRNNEWTKERGPLVTVTFDIDVERSTTVAVSPTSAHPMMALPRTSNRPSAVDNAKVSGTVTS